MNPLVPARNERGVALVMALLVLLVLSLLSATLLMSVNTETQIAGHSQRETQALNTAEAGLAEAVARIRIGDIPNNMNPRMVAQVFNTLPGSVPVLGADSVALATAQPAGQYLSYTKAAKGPDVLTVRYRTNETSPPTLIYKYDPTQNPAIQTVSGSPIFVITSTGYAGTDLRRIREEVIQQPFNLNVKAALAANTDIQFVGNAVVCGYNHSGSTPPPAGENGRAGSNSCIGYEMAGHLPGSWTTQGTINGGAATQTGVPTSNLSNQAGFYSGPWESLGMTQAEFFSWIGARRTTAPAPPNGIFYLDNNLTSQDQSGAFAYHGATGEGMLYVDGDLVLNSTFTYKGLIYVEGNLQLNGTAWILGGLIVRGKTKLMMNGAATILYSSEAIQQALSKYGGSMVPISWQEL
jgi:Tfp pilus assembly protein PilX